MQPTYLPWVGYFNLIFQSDIFVFLDVVQYERRSWQSRNRILVNGLEHLITVPIVKTSRDTPLLQIETSYSQGDWKKSHFTTIESAYSSANYGPDVINLLSSSYSQTNCCLLADNNINIIKVISKALGIQTKFVRASELLCSGKRSKLLASICKAVGANEYLSPQGSKQYLEEDNFAATSNIDLSFHEFLPRSYPQRRCENFVSHMSVVDMIGEIGIDESIEHICTNIPGLGNS